MRSLYARTFSYKYVRSGCWDGVYECFDEAGMTVLTVYDRSGFLFLIFSLVSLGFAREKSPRITGGEGGRFQRPGSVLKSPLNVFLGF